MLRVAVLTGRLLLPSEEVIVGRLQIVVNFQLIKRFIFLAKCVLELKLQLLFFIHLLVWLDGC